MLGLIVRCCTLWEDITDLTRASQQYAEADPRRKYEICDLIHAFVPYAAKRFADGDIGDETLGGQYGFQVVRWEEVGCCLSALLRVLPNCLARPSPAVAV